MKKNILIIILAVLLILSVGFSILQSNKNKVPKEPGQAEVKPEEKPAEETPVDETPVDETQGNEEADTSKPEPETSVRDTVVNHTNKALKKYGVKEIPSDSTWIIREQEPGRFISIVNQNSKNTHKVIMDVNGNDADLVKVIVNNRQVFSKYKR